MNRLDRARREQARKIRRAARACAREGALNVLVLTLPEPWPIDQQCALWAAIKRDGFVEFPHDGARLC